MKEVIKKIVIAVLAIVVVGAVVSFALKSDEPSVPEQSTSGTVSGDTQSTTNVNATANSNGTTAPAQPSQSPTNPQGGNVPQDSQSQQSVQSSQPQQGVQPTSNQPVSDTTTAAPQQVNKIDRYQEIFRSGNFLMKVKDPDLGDVIMAMNGNKMFVEASMEGLTLKMLYDGDKPDADNPENGTWFIVIDKIKKYSPMPADMIGDMNVEELTKDFANGDRNTVYTSSVETINGEQLDCESCVDQNGNTTKYYFRGDKLVRSDSISPSGEISVTEFEEIIPNADASLFAIPSGYSKWDISWLINMIG